MRTFSTVVSLSDSKIFGLKAFALIATKHRWEPGQLIKGYVRITLRKVQTL